MVTMTVPQQDVPIHKVAQLCMYTLPGFGSRVERILGSTAGWSALSSWMLALWRVYYTIYGGVPSSFKLEMEWNNSLQVGQHWRWLFLEHLSAQHCQWRCYCSRHSPSNCINWNTFSGIGNCLTVLYLPLICFTICASFNMWHLIVAFPHFPFWSLPKLSPDFAWPPNTEHFWVVCCTPSIIHTSGNKLSTQNSSIIESLGERMLHHSCSRWSTPGICAPSGQDWVGLRMREFSQVSILSHFSI